MISERDDTDRTKPFDSFEALTLQVSKVVFTTQIS